MKGINDSNFSINIRTELMGISILMIFIYHLVLFYERYSMKGLPLIDDITGKWYVGVDIFFFLSAYGLCQSFENNNYFNYNIELITRINKIISKLKNNIPNEKIIKKIERIL